MRRLRIHPISLVRFLGFLLAAGTFENAFAQNSESRPIPSADGLPIKEISPGVFQLGKARLSKAQHFVTFPAVLNMSEAALEYFLVAEHGKTHESLLRTDVDPYHINLALLLIGAKGADKLPFPEEDAEAIPGTSVDIEVSWKVGSEEKRVPAEQLIFNRGAGAAMDPGPWIYNGSLVLDGTFLAQQDGSIVSLILDPAAVINNPRRGAENDDLWEVRTNDLPALNWPVEVTIRLHRESKNLIHTPPPAPTGSHPQ